MAASNVQPIDAIVCELRIAATPETVFEYFTDPTLIVRWKGSSATLDPRPDGVYAVDVSATNKVRGIFVELHRPHRVVFTWGWEGESGPLPPGSSRVEVTLEPDGQGGTLLRLVHSGLVTPELRDQHREGWDHFLARLAIAAAGGDPGPDPWAN